MEVKLMNEPKLFTVIPDGTITSVPGIKACGVTAGLKKSGLPDMAMIVTDEPANFSGVFTSCVFAAAPVLLDRERVCTQPFARCVVINSGIANAGTGDLGLSNAYRTCEIAAKQLGISPEEVLVSSTGRIGTQLPMDVIEKGITLCAENLSTHGGADATRAIMTTDTVPKAIALEVSLNGKKVRIGAMTKGAGMIDPKLRGVPHATMLCYVTTDAKIENALLGKMLLANAEKSFNRITVDGDMSTNDTVIILANGHSGVTILEGSEEEKIFTEALLFAMQDLARRMVMDGEGATKFVTVKIENAATVEDAQKLAEAVGNSLLCKTAWFGCDPNWGRIVAALGYAGVDFDPSRVDVFYDDFAVVRNGGDAGTPEKELAEVLKNREFTVRVDMHAGSADFWLWTSDISYEYVNINAEYHT